MTEKSDDPRLAAILAESPVAIWFAFGKDLAPYVAQVRRFDTNRTHKTLVFIIVNSVEDAQHATKDMGADVLVVQGIEAGGHGGSYAPPLFTLLPAVLRALPDGPPILAAGGISTGAQIAALLSLGASGVAIGSRFLFTPECCYPDAYKSVLIRAGLNATVRGLCFDEVNRTMGWPPNHNGRAIANDICKDAEEGVNLEERLRRFDESKLKEENTRLVIWAGVGVGLTDEIKDTATVFQELHEDMVKTLNIFTIGCASYKIITSEGGMSNEL
ncbi:hypothetical protein HGRIS_005510 [Hohenbuehelia grisea]